MLDGAPVQGLPNVAALLALVNGNDKGHGTWVELLKIATSLVVHDGGLTGKLCA